MAMEAVLPAIDMMVFVMISVLSNEVVAYRAQLKSGQHTHKIKDPIVAKAIDR